MANNVGECIYLNEAILLLWLQCYNKNHRGAWRGFGKLFWKLKLLRIFFGELSHSKLRRAHKIFGVTKSSDAWWRLVALEGGGVAVLVNLSGSFQKFSTALMSFQLAFNAKVSFQELWWPFGAVRWPFGGFSKASVSHQKLSWAFKSFQKPSKSFRELSRLRWAVGRCSQGYSVGRARTRSSGSGILVFVS